MACVLPISNDYPWTASPPEHVRTMRELMERIVAGDLSGDELLLRAEHTLAMAEEFDAGDGSTSRFKPVNDWGLSV
jgi:hypothetical protein